MVMFLALVPLVVLSVLSLGVGGKAHFLGYFFKSLVPLFFPQGYGSIKLNLNLFWKIWICKKLPPQKPTASLEISILIEFVKQNENDSRYEADICTDALKGTGDIVC